MGINAINDSELLLYQPLLPGLYSLAGAWTWPFASGIGPSGSNGVTGPTDGSTIAAFNTLRIYPTSKDPANPSNYLEAVFGQTWTIGCWCDLTAATSDSAGPQVYETPGYSGATNGTFRNTAVNAGSAGYATLSFTVSGLTTVALKIAFGSITAITCPANSNIFMSQFYACQEPSFSGYAPSPGQTYGAWTATELAAQSLTTATA